MPARTLAEPNGPPRPRCCMSPTPACPGATIGNAILAEKRRIFIPPISSANPAMTYVFRSDMRAGRSPRLSPASSAAVRGRISSALISVRPLFFTWVTAEPSDYAAPLHVSAHAPPSPSFEPGVHLCGRDASWVLSRLSRPAPAGRARPRSSQLDRLGSAPTITPATHIRQPPALFFIAMSAHALRGYRWFGSRLGLLARRPDPRQHIFIRSLERREVRFSPPMPAGRRTSIYLDDLLYLLGPGRLGARR